MPDTENSSYSDATVPFSDDAFEAAMERINPHNRKPVENQEVEEEEEETIVVDDPEDEDDVVDDSDEVDTPEDVEDEETSELVEDSQESRKKKGLPSKTKTPNEDDEATPKLSRKQRGKLIQELTQELQKQQQRNEELSKSQQRDAVEEKRLEEEIAKALGSDEAYEKALEAGLRGDETEGQRARIWKANRKFYDKLVLSAERNFQKKFTIDFWDSVGDLEGVNKETLQHGTIPQILQHLYFSGRTQVDKAKDEKIAELEEQLETLQAKIGKVRIQAGSTKRSPVGPGGNTVRKAGAVSWKDVGLDPSTGLPTDEMEALVSQYGQRAFSDPNILKLLHKAR